MPVSWRGVDATRALDRPAVRRVRRVRLFGEGDPDQARLRVAPDRRADAAHAADAFLRAVLPRDGLVVEPPPRARPLTRADWKSFVALGFIGYYLASLFDFMGLAYITAALERLVLFLYPTMVVVLSSLVLRKPITRRVVLALLLSYAGIAIVFAARSLGSGRPRGAVDRRRARVRERGLYAVYLVAAGGVIARVGSMRFISYAMLASTVFVVRAVRRDPRSRGAAPAGVDLRAVAGDGRGVDGAAHVADRRGDTSHRRERVVADRLAGPRLHDRARRRDPRRADALRSSSPAPRWCSSASCW